MQDIVGLHNDEIMNGIFTLKEVDSVVYEVDCMMVDKEVLAEDRTTVTSVKVNNVVECFRLHEIFFDKKGYLTYLMDYMKSIEKALEGNNATADEISVFKTNSRQFGQKRLLRNLMNINSIWVKIWTRTACKVVLMRNREDGVTPYVSLWKHGLLEKTD
ncbi:Mss4-like protein [Talaromyces proteolyticus]|uniref:Translationally-controlled tumor protein homolog n=1 Tax=Talaromyces proteolyticus TaxID=1131652 RepID=A0AAD4KH11_9EURO|nr:Mss4-like protein [Talaromyces proteolyticus]KAH8689304.1 Mss4-like protein [Talaromyces proteolyticus]